MDRNPMKQRRDTAADWASANPILAQGEFGIDLTALAAGTSCIKVGDGSTTWNNLPFTNTLAGGLSLLETTTAASATTLVLTAASTQVQTITGNVAQSVQLPTGVKAGYTCVINNQLTGTVAVTVKASAGATFCTIPWFTSMGIFRAVVDNPTLPTHWAADIRQSGTALTILGNESIAITYNGTVTTWGLPTAVGVPAAVALAQWDIFKSLSANAFIALQTTTAASATPIVLSYASTQIQVITGTTTAQVIELPSIAIPAGYEQVIINQMTTAIITVEASGGTVVGLIAPGEIGVFRSEVAGPTLNTQWMGDIRLSGVSFKALTGKLVITTAGTSVVYTLPAATTTLLGGEHLSVVNEYFATTTGIAVPAGITGVWIESLIQAGSGGGSGRRGAAGTVRCGGGAGSAGAMIKGEFIPVALLSSTLNVTIPVAGAGGAAVGSDNTNGTNGTASLAASITSGSNTWTTLAGGAGNGGSTTAGAGGAASAGPIAGAAGGSASTIGGVGVAGGFTSNGGASGGGSGGGITSADTPNVGGTGGFQTLQFGLTTAQGGLVGGASPGAGSAAVAGIGGLGAGGGAASITGAAQAGADATGYGAGGGGGGASLNGNASGKGGNGGPPYCRLRWVFV